MYKQDLNLTEKVKELSLQKAIETLEAAAAEEAGVSCEEAIGAYLKVWERYQKLGTSLDKAKKAIKKVLKANDAQINVTTEIKDKSGNVVSTIAGSFGQYEDVTDSIDWDQLKTEKGITIAVDPNNPAKIVIEAANAADLALFKAPVLAGNPTAVNAAINAGTLDAKYRHSVTTTKSDIRLNITENVQ